MHLGNYLKIIMIKKGVSGQDLANLLNKQKGMSVKNVGNATVTKYQVSYWINGKERISPLMARRIEIALDLPKNSLLRLTNKSTANMREYNIVFGKEGDEEG